MVTVPPLSDLPGLFGAIGYLQRCHTRVSQSKDTNVRPIISADFKGYKWVAVGDAVYRSSKWKTFHDFLFDYLRSAVGGEWGNAELRKVPSERHPVVQWYISVCHFQRQHIKKEGEIYSGICTGTVAAYLSLAYDLYILRHHALLQNRLVERLKKIDQFQGARYEIYVTAAFVRAGFEIDPEDETDRKRTHCEFRAVHKETRKKLSVEAKSRHRPGLLGRPGKLQSPEEIRLRIGRLLRSALAKRASDTRVVFVDINMPPEDVGPFADSWFRPLADEIERVERSRINGRPAPQAYVIITNHPYHYVGDEQPDPPKNFLMTAINVPEFKQQQNGSAGPIDPTIVTLWDSINKHTTIPHTFDD